MRGLLRRRRRRILFIWVGMFSLFFSLFPFVLSQRQLFYEQLRIFLEEEGAQALGLDVKIDSFQTTPWGEGILRGLSFGRSGGQTLCSVQEVSIPFDIGEWGRRSPRPRFSLTVEGGECQGGPLRLTALEGRLFVRTTSPWSLSQAALFRGTVGGTWKLLREGGRFQLTFHRRSPLWVEGELRLDSTVSGLLHLDLFQERPDRLDGSQLRIKAPSLRLKERPVGSLWVLLQLKGDSLVFKKVMWENSLQFAGTLSRKRPYTVEGRLEADLSRQTLRTWVGQGVEENLPDRIRGWIAVGGSLPHPRLQGHLQAREGQVKGVSYEWIHGTVYGSWPHVTVDSEINHGLSRGFSFTRGLVDLGAFGKNGWYKTIEMEPSREVALWKDLEMRVPKTDVLVIGKSNAREMVQLKAFFEEGPLMKEEDAFELEYRLPSSKKVLKMRLEGKNSFMGVGHRVQF